LDGPGVESITLGPLHTEEVVAIVRDIVGAEPDREFLSVAEGAGGNPALLVELVEGLDEEGAVDVSQSVARVIAARVPQRVEAIAAYRLGRLSPDTRRLVEVASVLGRSFSVDDLSDLLGVLPAALLPFLEEAQNAGLLVPQSRALAFRHELVRWAIYEGISESIRLALHHQIAEMLIARGHSDVAAADHLVQGGAQGEPETLATLDRAASELLGSSPDAAANLALRALELTPEEDDARFRRRLAAVNALVLARRLVEAEKLAGAALPRGPADVAARLHLVRSEILLFGERPAESLADAQAVLEGGDVPQDVFGGAEVARLLGVLTQGSLQEVRYLAEALLAGNDDRGGAVGLVGGLTALALIAWSDARVADALGLVRAAFRRSEGTPAGAHRIHSLLTLATLLATVGDFDEASDVIESARDTERHTREVQWSAFVPYVRARVHLAAGRLHDAADEARTGLAVAEEVGARIAVPANTWVLASVALLHGDLESAATHVRAYEGALAPIERAPGSATYRFTAARVAEARGDKAAAAVLFGPIYIDPVAHGMLFAIDPTAASCLVRSALATGDRHGAEAVAAAAASVSASSPGVAALAAGAAQARGIVGRDIDALDEAARDHLHPWARASALEDAAGMAVDGSGQRTRLDDSLNGYEDIGATRDAERVHTRLEQGERSQRTRVRKPVEGWPSLTDTEQRVSRLVADGLTNPQVADRLSISRHTVDFHLRQVFRKLDINSRVELTRLALEQEGD
jgi:DNA-binding CsgD family transcriptional regulator/tetratricopeptide (TPR) repeat protein